ncbi:hypothetical protein A3C73_01480 [Candidatus Giovannonibacteria bacterium RIFCSPHIGHO2_02_FULL_44_11]|nr:MAG: hypothetical protein A3C73_01480 [Candidatus Giovannonibacteria bacterium RIFCSPHIGHO2_02_FULL_44_11]
MKRGFTLIELLVVVGIIGILASIILVRLNLAREKAKIVRARAEVKQIRTAVVLLEGDSGEWPGHKTLDDIETGVSNNEMWDLSVQAAGIIATDGNFARWSGPYMNVMPKDPWGNDYFFDTDYDIDPTAGTQWAAVIGSFGPNGDGQNVYDSDDIFEILTAQ